eukprot:TRINITY_DN17948_c0_g3_i1.p1 TRINITY_DN17948_c0_g3~~TRINITY_DN17948_c0_g3_i1.p1  ORF type:complete len:621 (+),score=193.70 TRINITY_DN17948_c0_g3_i1:76-1938(+)
MRAAWALLTAAGSAAAGPDRPPTGFWPDYVGGRKATLLDGEWGYGLHFSKIDSLAPGLDVTGPSWTPNKTSVPMTFDASPPGYLGPRGVAVYRTRFHQQAGPARIQFNACSFYCRVWVDGKEIGEHRAGGYVVFHLDVPAVDSDTDRELVVLADNRINTTTAPTHTGGDFWMYGGLMRSVLLHRMPASSAGPWPWRAYFLPVESGYQRGVVNLTVALSDPSFAGDWEGSVTFDKGTAQPLRGTAQNGTVQFPGVVVPSPRLWSLADPQLHTATVVGKDGAGLTERFGLRWWGVDKASSRITLNGKVTKLHGWNHHQQWPEVGASPTEEMMDADLAMMVKAGTNYIRGAHYPQDPRWTDRLDELGIAIWEETLGPDVTLEDTQSKYFMQYQLQQLDEMQDQALNHPAILAWGWFNEGPSDKQSACDGYKACSDRAAARDPTRFRSWADNKEMRSRCLKHASMIAFNNYPGWYGDPGNLDDATAHWNKRASEVRATYPGVPFVISETGAGGIYEWDHNETAAMWTQKYQVQLIERDVQVALQNDNISGITLWHFFDFKVDDSAIRQCGHCDYIPSTFPPNCSYIDVTCRRPGGENHKGVVDFWRREKQALPVVGKLYNDYKD